MALVLGNASRERMLPQVRKLEGGGEIIRVEQPVRMSSDMPGSEEVVLQFSLLFPGFPLVETVPSQHCDKYKWQTDS